MTTEPRNPSDTEREAYRRWSKYPARKYGFMEGAEWQRASDTEEIGRLEAKIGTIGQIAANIERERAALAQQLDADAEEIKRVTDDREMVMADRLDLMDERDALAQQIAAVRAAWDASTGWHQFGEDVRAILDPSPVTPESETN